MKKLWMEKIGLRINQLIESGSKVLASKYQAVEYGNKYVNDKLFFEFKTASLSFIQNLYSQNHSYYQNFSLKAKDAYPTDTEIGIGILNAIKTEIDEGWLIDLKSLLTADIFADFVEMALYLLEEGFKDAAAVMIGGVLEEFLRQMCLKNNIEIEFLKGDKKIFKKADQLNNELYTMDIYNKLDQKTITTWLDLRNKAAHGKYDEYSKDQVDLMCKSVMELMNRLV